MWKQSVANRVKKLEQKRILHSLPVFIDAPSNVFQKASFDNHEFNSRVDLQNYCDLMGMQAKPQIIMNIPKPGGKQNPVGSLSARGGGVN